MKSVATAKRTAGGYPVTPSQPAIVFSASRHAESTSSTTPVASQSSA